jgi:hypothetical protein
MSDVAVEQTPAESSAATEQQTLEIPKGGQEYAEWRMKGTTQQSKEASTPSSEKADSEPASRERKARSNADSRLTELLNDMREAGISPSELKSFKQTYQRVHVQQQEAQPQKQQQPQATPEKTEQPAADAKNAPPKRPRLDEWTGTMGEYEEAVDKYYDQLTDYKLNNLKLEEQQRENKKQLDVKIAEANTRYGDGAESTIKSTATSLFTADIHPAVKQLVDQSPVVVDLCYVLGTKDGELQSLIEQARTNPTDAIRRVVLLEQLVKEELGKSPAPASSRGEDGKFRAAEVEASPIPEKKPSKAPAPPAEVSGRGSTPSDPQQHAIKTNDFAAFRAAGNRREIDRKKGR